MHYPLAVVKARDVSVARAVQKKVQEKRNHWRRIASLSHEFRTLNTTDVYSNAAHIRPLRMEHMTTVVVEVMTTMSVSNGNSTRCTVLCFHLSRTTWNSIVFFSYFSVDSCQSLATSAPILSLSLSLSRQITMRWQIQLKCTHNGTTDAPINLLSTQFNGEMSSLSEINRVTVFRRKCK